MQNYLDQKGSKIPKFAGFNHTEIYDYKKAKTF